MKIEKLTLRNFRNHKSLTIEPAKNTVRAGKIVKQCNHTMLAISTHEDFLHKGWLCLDCGEFILKPNTEGYKAAICMFKVGK